MFPARVPRCPASRPTASPPLLPLSRAAAICAEASALPRAGAALAFCGRNSLGGPRWGRGWRRTFWAEFAPRLGPLHGRSEALGNLVPERRKDKLAWPRQSLGKTWPRSVVVTRGAPVIQELPRDSAACVSGCWLVVEDQRAWSGLASVRVWWAGPSLIHSTNILLDTMCVIRW